MENGMNRRNEGIYIPVEELKRIAAKLPKIPTIEDRVARGEMSEEEAILLEIQERETAMKAEIYREVARVRSIWTSRPRGRDFSRRRYLYCRR